MELGFMDVVIIIIGTLSIVLFFKVWIMTNKVSNIAKHICKNKDYSYFLIKGDIDGLSKVLEDNMLMEISKVYQGEGIDSDETTKMSKITTLINNYGALFERYGIEFPDRYKEYTNEDKLSELLSK